MPLMIQLSLPWPGRADLMQQLPHGSTPALTPTPTPARRMRMYGEDWAEAEIGFRHAAEPES
jgi:hypothetical protein